MVMDKKRPRDETAGATECGRSSVADAEQGAKRRRVGGVGFGLGTFAGLMGKAFRATASMFGGGSGQQR